MNSSIVIKGANPIRLSFNDGSELVLEPKDPLLSQAILFGEIDESFSNYDTKNPILAEIEWPEDLEVMINDKVTTIVDVHERFSNFLRKAIDEALKNRAH